MGGTYLPTFDGEGYLPWMWGGVPTLDGGRGTYLGGGGGTYLGWGEGVLTLTGYAVGSMPLAFMQKDFLLILNFSQLLLVDTSTLPAFSVSRTVK